MRGRLVARLREVSSNICSTRAIGSVIRFSFKLVSHLSVCFPQTIVCGSALYKYASEDFLSFLSPVCLAGFLKTLPPNGPFVSNSHWATIAFFSSTTFYLLALSFSPFLFLRQCDFGDYRPKKPAFWGLFTQMMANFFSLVFKNNQLDM